MNRAYAVIGLTAALAGISQAGDPGTTSANFLKLGVGPRAMAMGEAQVGLADDVYATYWNPAGLAQLTNPQAGFVQTQYIQDITSQYVAYAYPTRRYGTLAASFTHLGVGNFDAYDASGQPAGQVDSSDNAFAISYAHSLLQNKRLDMEFSAGGTARYLEETLASVSAQAFAADAGAHFTPGRLWGSWLTGTRFGISLRNLGTSMKFDRESFDLPRTFTAGMAWTGTVLGESVTCTLDGMKPNDDGLSWGGGIELWTLKTLVVRGGYTTRGDLGNGLRAGAGLRFHAIQIDYAFAAQGDLGDIHRIGITFQFGREPSNPLALAQDWYDKGLRDYERHRYTDALVDFNKALEVDPSHPQALEMMKNTYEQLRRQPNP